MRRKHGRPQEEAEVNITPMLDVVFILLIFFIVTATFVKEDGLYLSRPNPNDEPDKPQNLDATIFVQITDQNEIFIENRVIDVDAVRANIERLHSERPKAGVLISPSKEAETGILVRVMDQANLGCPGCGVSIASGG